MSQPREVRYAAAQAFEESLKQLQHRLEAGEEQAPNLPPKAQPQSTRTCFDLDLFEAAIADIDQFIQANHPHA